MKELRAYLEMPSCRIPAGLEEKISSGKITPLSIRESDSLLSDRELRYEAGICDLGEGKYLAAMYCDMPGVTREMVKWWFWWHPVSSLRYRIWYPGEHFAVGYKKENRAYFESLTQPEFMPNTQYPVESIGGPVMPLSIDFMRATDFGFSEKAMTEGKVALIVCGRVGALWGAVKHTDMAHIFFESENGLFMISRFWLGEELKSSVLRRVIFNEKLARSMARHCAVEYRNLAKRLPGLYENQKGALYGG